MCSSDLLFADGKDKIADGLKTYEEMRRRQVQQYLERLRWATIERTDHLNPALRAYAQSANGAPAAG